MFKPIVFAAVLAVARAGLLGSPAVATYAAAPVAHYSPATAVSSSYIHQNHVPVAAVHAAPALAAVHAAPAFAPVAAVHAAPLAAAVHAAPAFTSYAAHSAPVAISAPFVGASHQSVLRSPGGNQAVSHYAKAVDSAFSSVRKYDTRITNDALSVAAVHAAPVAAVHAAPLAAFHSAPVAAYSTAPVAAVHAAPIVAKTAAVAYSPAAVVSHATFTGLGTHYAW